jgi:hypothetical protein
LFAALSIACSGIGSDPGASEVEITPARFLDHVCASGSFELEGSAKLTSGPTPDSCGFVLGPAPGVVTFHVDPLIVSGNIQVTEALIVDDDAGSDNVPEWRVVGDDYGPVNVSADDRRIRIVDLRLKAITPPSTGCAG